MGMVTPRRPSLLKEGQHFDLTCDGLMVSFQHDSGHIGIWVSQQNTPPGPLAEGVGGAHDVSPTKGLHVLYFLADAEPASIVYKAMADEIYRQVEEGIKGREVR
jgi:hypothetical protein